MDDARHADRWPAWFGPAGLVAAFALTASAVGAVAVLLGPGTADGPGVALFGLVVQNLLLVGTAVVLALSVGRVDAADLGVTGLSLRRLAVATATAAAAFYAVSLVAGLLIGDTGEQDTLKRLGADRGAGLLLASGAVVILAGPWAEELFFRGFFYRSLRNRLAVPAAIAVSAALFGVLHYTGPETLVLLPVLALLGAAFCLLYERTGSLLPSIVLHVLNNAIAFASADEGDPAAAAALALLGLGSCAVVARRAAPRRWPSAK